MFQKSFYAMLLILGVLFSSRTASAHDSEVDLDNHVLKIESDDSHDVIVVRNNPEDLTEIEVLIVQFDDPVQLFSFVTEDELFEAADDFRDEYYEVEDVESIEINALGGDDWILVFSDLPCLLIGGRGHDWIRSGNGDDVIWGDDEFVVTGSLGGEDTIYGERGDEKIHGGPLSDMIKGGLDNDDLFGDDGADIMDGDSGDDEMWGGPEDDRMYGGTGNDQMYGESGDDDLFGEDGQDNLFGGDDNDFLDGSYDGEIDVMEGGAGADEFVNRYYETRTYVYYQIYVYYVPVYTFDGYMIRIEYQRRYFWVPVVGSYQYNFEIEFLNDFSYADGDTLSPVEVD